MNTDSVQQPQSLDSQSESQLQSQQQQEQQVQAQSQQQPNENNKDNQSPEEIQAVITALKRIDDLKFFLQTAPTRWNESQVIRRFRLNEEEGFVSCVYWSNLYYITGTDIVRCVAYKIKKFGRKIIDRKKFEEGIFSDLRSLKCDSDAQLEQPRSPFLAFLHRNQCIRTQKKQKVFYWFSVPHDKLFADALERDLKREMSSQKATTVAIAEPSLSLKYDQSTPLIEQITQLIQDRGYNNDRLYESDGVFLEDQIGSQLPNIDGANGNKIDPSLSRWGSSTNTISGDGMMDGSRMPQSDDDFPLDYMQTAGTNGESAENYQFSGSEYVTLSNQPMVCVDPAMYMASPAGISATGTTTS
ncbi:unnamed protein product [Ambrosiozyma monospora]|uniref:Unnamed protein product n=1 Tax=Ambrosiozyma monospora TaxID=43982 RepID=A0ACB5TDP8_AMBMO|nr:unnamed protein product [Ambrosiozyma monospora]